MIAPNRLLIYFINDPDCENYWGIIQYHMVIYIGSIQHGDIDSLWMPFHNWSNEMRVLHANICIYLVASEMSIEQQSASHEPGHDELHYLQAYRDDSKHSHGTAQVLLVRAFWSSGSSSVESTTGICRFLCAESTVTKRLPIRNLYFLSGM